MKAVSTVPASPESGGSPEGHSTPQRSLRRLGRDTVVYGVAMVLSRLVSFVMLPIYTRYLTPADYGLLSILDLSLEIAVLLLSAGATAGLMRFYFKAKEAEERNQVLYTAWATTTSLYAVGTVLLMVVAPLIWKYALGGAGTVGMVRLAAMNFTLSSLMIVPTEMLIIDQRPTASSIVLTLKLVLQLSLNILFVVVLKAGPIGVLWSTFISSLVLGLVLTVLLLRRTGIAWSWPAFRDLRRFSLPIQLSKAGTFFLAYGDRFFLEKFHGLAVVGVYGIAYQFGFIVTGMLWGPFWQAWNPQRFQLAHDERSHRDALYNRGFLYGNMFIVSGAVGISLFIRPALDIMTTAKFHSAAAFVPLIVLAYVFQCWSNVVDFGIEVSEKTRYTSMATWIAVGVIAVLYVLLIPPYGAMGAAIATLVAMFVRFLATLHFAQRLWPVSYHWAPHIRMVLGGIGVTIGALLVPAGGVIALVAVASVGFLVYLAWVWAAVLHADDRATIALIVKSPRSLPAILRGAA